MDDHKNKPNAIEKALDILMAFAPENPEMGTVEISQRMGLHKATASRILLTLTRRGFLQQNPTNKKFRLGRSSLLIGRAAAIQKGLVALARPYVDQLRDELNETVMIEKLDGEQTTLLYVAEGQQRHRITSGVGDRLPAHATAGAKAILAFSDDDSVARLLAGRPRFSPITPKTICDPQTLIKQLQTIRISGVAFDEEEYEIGINAIAHPIFNHENVPVASVVVVGPCHRIPLQYQTPVTQKAKETARKISAALMHE